MRKCKITVLKTLKMDELTRQFTTMEPAYCHCMKEGDVFFTGGVFGTEMPEGFCASAWDAIGCDAGVFASGGVVHNVEAEHHVSCCPDGLRPVIFLLEPFDDGAPAE